MNFIANIARRHVVAANFNFYAKPTLHPDRILEEHDIVFMEQGNWEITQDETSYPLQSGDIIFLAAGRHHYGQIPCSPKTRTMYIHIAADYMDGIYEDAYAIPTVIPAGTSPHLRQDFLNLIDAWWTDMPNRSIRVAALLDILLCDLAAADMKAGARQYGWPVDAVHSILVNDPSVNYTVQEIAEQLGLTARNLRYLFTKVSGCSLHRYQLDLKLNMAKQALQLSARSTLADVSLAFGFWDEYHFSHAFTKRFGYRPSQVEKR